MTADDRSRWLVALLFLSVAMLSAIAALLCSWPHYPPILGE